MSLRYFRAPLAVYHVACGQLDEAYGYPNAETKTDQTLPLAEQLPKDSEGRVYLAVAANYADYVLPSEIIAIGAVEEITAEQYWAVFPPRPGVW